MRTVDNFAASFAAALLLTLVAAGSAAAQNDAAEEVPLIGEEQREQADAAATVYWLGVSCTTIDDARRAELKLGDVKGVIVMDIVPDSPAAKAGLKNFDVLLGAGEQEFVDPHDLVRAVQEAKGGEIKLKLIRAGEQQEIAVTPEKRPAELDRKNGFFFKSFNPPAAGPFSVRIVHPGQLVGSGMALAAGRPDLPADMTVTIIKTGKEPATVRVNQGENSWEATEDKLDDLPENVRGHAEAMLGRITIPLPRPPGMGDVLTYVPNHETLARQARERADDARQRVEEASRAAIDAANKRMAEARQRAEAAGRSAVDAANAQAQSTIDKGLNWLSERQVEDKIDAIDRQLDELRAAVRTLRERRAAPPGEQIEAPAPEKPAEETP